MSSSRKTSKYQLSQFELNSDDRPSWYDDYNVDMRSIENNSIHKSGGTITGNLTVNGNLSAPNGNAVIKAWDLHARGGTVHLNANSSAGIQSIGPQSMAFYASLGETNRGILYGVADADWMFGPIVNNQVLLGNPNRKWRQIYCNDSTIHTSDRNEKQSIEMLDDDMVVDFINGLQAISYKWIQSDSGRTHFGFVSQDVEALMEKLGMSSFDFAGFIKSPKTKTIFKEIEQPTGELNDDGTPVVKTIMEPASEEVPGEYVYGLRYEEFIPILWRYCQIVSTKINQQEAKNADFEARLSALEVK